MPAIKEAIAVCDDTGNTLRIIMDQDGDIHVSIVNKETGKGLRNSVRIRTAMGGGHQYRTRTALIRLIEAIEDDVPGNEPKEERPKTWILFLNGEPCYREPDKEEFNVGDEVRLYEFAGGCIVAEVDKVDGDIIYMHMTGAEPCF